MNFELFWLRIVKSVIKCAKLHYICALAHHRTTNCIRASYCSMWNSPEQGFSLLLFRIFCLIMKKIIWIALASDNAYEHSNTVECCTYKRCTSIFHEKNRKKSNNNRNYRLHRLACSGEFTLFLYFLKSTVFIFNFQAHVQHSLCKSFDAFVEYLKYNKKECI